MVPYVSPRSGRPLEPEGMDLVAGPERYPVVGGIPRFVLHEGYAASFGLQWRKFARTQLDSHTGSNVSRTRLERCLGVPLARLAGLDVLEAGCGAGRFTELLVEARARVHSIDMSLAVEANRENLGPGADYRVAQADLLALPFPPEAFDVVLCLGVLQHLPSPEAGIQSLWSRVKPGGLLVIDHYRWSVLKYLRLAHAVRALVLRLPPERALACCNQLADLFFPVHWAFRDSRLVQRLLTPVSPCLVYFHEFPGLDRAAHFELCRLDTHDQLTDAYKHFRTPASIHRTLAGLGAREIDVTRGGNGVEARARKPVPHGGNGG